MSIRVAMAVVKAVERALVGLVMPEMVSSGSTVCEKAVLRQSLKDSLVHGQLETVAATAFELTGVHV